MLAPLNNLLASQGFWHWAWFGDHASSSDARTSDHTFMFLWWLSVFWFILLMGLMAWWCVRWRRKPGVPAPRSASHNTPLEITWTIIPTLILVVIFFRGFWDYVERIVARGDSLRLSLVAYKWNWEMVYPSVRGSIVERTSVGGRLGEAPIFVVPEDAGVSLQMTSRDVIHSFWVPDWRIKCDIFPNRYTGLWFETEKIDEADPEVLVHEDESPGSAGPAFEERYHYKDHYIFCAEYCGDFHSEMAGIIRVVPRAVYAAWVNDPGINWTDAAPGGPKQLWQIGEIFYTNKGCSSCHTVNGSAGTGPTWAKTATTGWGTNVPLSDGSTVLFDENYFRRSVYTPAAQLHAGFANQMTVFTPDSLNERELGALQAYIMHLAGVEMDPFAVETIIGGGAGGTTEPGAAAPPATPPASTPAPAPHP